MHDHLEFGLNAIVKQHYLVLTFNFNLRTLSLVKLITMRTYWVEIDAECTVYRQHGIRKSKVSKVRNASKVAAAGIPWMHSNWGDLQVPVISQKRILDI